MPLEKLLKNRAYQMLFDNSQEGLMIARPDGSFVEVNDAFCTMLGYSHDELMRLIRPEITVPGDPALREALRIRAETGSFKGALKLRRKDGSIIDAEISSAIYKDENGEERTYICATDITEKQKAENELRVNEHRLRSMIAHGHDIITLINADGSVKYRSPSYKQIFGYGTDELGSGLVFENIHPDDVTKLREGFINLAKQPGASMTNQWRQQHKDGNYRWMEGTGTNLLHDPDINAIVCNFRDITEHILIEHQLEQSNKELNRIFNTIDEVVYSAERNPYKLTQMSDACMKLYGHPASDFFKHPKLWLDVILDEDKHLTYEMGEILEQGIIATGQYRIRHRDGTIKWVEATVTPTLDASGRLIRLDGVNRDVTEKKKAEEAISLSEKRYRALIENSKDGIALTGPDRLFTYIAPQIKSMFGYAAEELIGTHPLAMYHPDDHERIFHFVEGIKEKNKPYSIEDLRIHHKDGSWRWVELTFCDQFDDPAVNAMVCNFRDTTDKKRDAEALINSEKRFRTLIENNKEGISLSSTDRRFIYLSPSIKNILGYEPEELIGTLAYELYHPDSLGEIAQMVKELTDGTIQSATKMMRVRHKSGSWRWIEFTATNQLDNPAINALVTNFRDVSERKRAEEEMERLNQSLERKVEERTLELQESNKALESFTYIAAHDLQAPLRVLTGYASILKKEHGSAMAPDARTLLDTVIHKSHQMSQLVSDLLTFSRASHIPMVRAQVDFDMLVSDISDQLALTAMGSTVSAEIDILSLGTASCDSGLMRQVWSNLISNALKYSAKQEKPLIVIGRKEIEGETVFYIQDNGAGFDMKYADRLFQVFNRLHAAADFEGSGIGLALVRNIIVRHGGRIWAEAAVSKGATFYFTLPE